MADRTDITTRPRRASLTDKMHAHAARTAARKERERLAWIAELDATHPRYYGICYFMAGDEGPIKIGYSNDPGRRLNEIALQAGYQMTLLATANGGYMREAYYHRLFAAHRLHGEWFARCPEIEAEIAHLNTITRRAA